MTLFSRGELDQQLGRWAGVGFVDQWDAHVAKVGGKVFCALSDDEPARIVFKCEETSFDILTAIKGIEQAPYFAKRHWVSVSAGAMPDAELWSYLERSYSLVASGLTKKLRADLGIGSS